MDGCCKQAVGVSGDLADGNYRRLVGLLKEEKTGTSPAKGGDGRGQGEKRQVAVS